MYPDTIRVIGLSFSASHGAEPEEGTLEQPFEVDVEVCLDLSEAAQSDRLDRTISYVRIADEVSAVMNGPRWFLIEKLAGLIMERVAALVKKGEITVRVRKPQARLKTRFDTVEVELRRIIGKT